MLNAPVLHRAYRGKTHSPAMSLGAPLKPPFIHGLPTMDFGNPAPGTGSGAFISLPADPILAASLLYETLFRLDRNGLDLILVESPPETSEWAAVRDRLTRAAAQD